ncbi:MAG TPA: CDP-alcohol phosphatidyltransferase family protein [Candidatus Binataceae bacterium]|nr:CDP-alcohol phosphatidyltransferase family protein [Candidatus Binataceae bacterium]
MAAPIHHPNPHHAKPKEPEGLVHLLNLPNFLTLCRLGSVPIFLTLLSRSHYTAALYIFGAAAITDGLDGAAARWFDARTELGAFLDPFADKVMLVSAFIVLTLNGTFPGYVLSVVAIRDLVVVAGYMMLSFFTSERIPVRPTFIGKLSTCLQALCIIAALAKIGVPLPRYLNAMLYITVTATAISGVQYIYQGLQWLYSREPEMFT